MVKLQKNVTISSLSQFPFFLIKFKLPLEKKVTKLGNLQYSCLSLPMMSVNEAIMDINKEFQQRKEFYKGISVKAAFVKEEGDGKV